MMRGTDNTTHNPSCQFGLDRSTLVLENSECEIPLRHGRGWWPCSNVSTSHVDSLREDRIKDISRENLNSMVSSTPPQHCRNNQSRSVDVGREWFRRVYHRHETTHEVQFRKGYWTSLAEAQRSDARNVVGCDLL